MGKKSTATKNKWNAANYDRVNLTVAKGKKETIKQHAESRGETVNSFINRAIDETMTRDQGGSLGLLADLDRLNAEQK